MMTATTTTKIDRPALTHLGVYTDQPERMRDFYVQAMGLTVSDTGVGRFFPRRIIFLTGDPTQHHQFVLVVREPGDPPGGALFQLSFKVRSLDELRAVTARGLAHGATGLKRIDHGNSWSVYFDDPDRNTVEVYLDTGWHVPQPYAELLDLELPDAEIRRLTDERVARIAGTLPAEQWSRQMAARFTPQP